MFGPLKLLDAANSWARLGLYYSQMNFAAAEVMTKRMARISQGKMSGGEAVGMIMEKATAFAKASEQASVAAARGADPVSIATEAIKPYRSATRSNVKRLRK